MTSPGTMDVSTLELSTGALVSFNDELHYICGYSCKDGVHLYTLATLAKPHKISKPDILQSEFKVENKYPTDDERIPKGLRDFLVRNAHKKFRQDCGEETKQ